MIFLDRAKLRAMGESAAWLTGRRQRVRIVGDSMLPTLAEGQFVLLDRRQVPVAGQLAVAEHPHQPDLLVVKRVESVTADGRFVLSSDNPDAGTDSRAWGPIAAEAVHGTVTLLLDSPSTVL
ncbi:MAG: nickel-type superoxide dismutase maturation protease [Acidimicrobiales bacterium]